MSLAGIIVLALGASLLLAALVWRVVQGQRARLHLLQALADPDERVRAAAVEVAANGGIARFAPVFLGLVNDDPSPLVRRRVVEVLTRNQWEPAADPAVVALRVHTQQLLDHERSAGEGLRRPAALTLPALDDPEAGVGQSDSGRRAATSAPGRTVLVTGAGGPAGISVVRALRRSGHRVVAVDVDPLAAGLRLGDEAGIVPRADDARFVEVLLEIATASGATAVVPTIAEELLVLAAAGSRLDGAGIAHFVPDASAVLRCIDKWEFAATLSGAGVPAPPTALGSADGVPGPWIVKPRFGRGSRDVYVVEQLEHMPVVLERVPDPIVQTRLEGREFTVDALVDRDGELVGAVPRWRLETRGGISTKGETFEDVQLTEGIGKLLRSVGLTGAANIQGFADSGGTWAFVEVNPRFSGGLPLSLAAGADLVGEYLRAVVNESPSPERLRFRPGVRMTRYFEEVFEG